MSLFLQSCIPLDAKRVVSACQSCIDHIEQKRSEKIAELLSRTLRRVEWSWTWPFRKVILFRPKDMREYRLYSGSYTPSAYPEEMHSHQRDVAEVIQMSARNASGDVVYLTAADFQIIEFYYENE